MTRSANSRQSSSSAGSSVVYEYGCAGDDRCLIEDKRFWFRQPNGNKFCFTNYPSIELAQDKCKQFNVYWPGSCTHIVSYQMYTGEYRWELLNRDAVTKCEKDFDLQNIQIDAFRYPNQRQYSQDTIRRPRYRQLKIIIF